MDSGLLVDNVEIQSLNGGSNFTSLGLTDNPGMSEVDLILGDSGFESIGSNSTDTDLVLGSNGFEVI